MNFHKKSYQQFDSIFLTLTTSVFILFLVLLTLQQANPLDTKLGRDSGIYLYVANTLTKGELPYVDAWESKPPGIFFINAFALWIGSGTRWGIWLIEFLFLFLSIQLGFSLLKKQFGLLSAFIGISVGLWGLNRVLAGGNFTEEYSLLFGFAALWLWMYSNNPKTLWSDIGIGLCTGCTILLRPNNIGVQAAIGITLLILAFINKEFKVLLTRFLVIAVSAFVPIFVAGLFFASKGAFNEFLEASLLYNLYYTGGNLDLRSSFLAGISSLGGAGGIFLFSYFVIAYQVFSKRQDSVNVISLWVLVNGFLEIFLSGLSGKAFEHYFICLIPIVTISSAYLVSFVFPDSNILSRKYPLQLSLSAFFIGLILFSHVPQYYLKTVDRILNQREKGVQYIDPVAAYVDANTKPGDLVLVWGGQAGINFLSKRNASTPYIFYPLFEPSPFTDQISLAYYRLIQNNRPVLILDGSVYDPEKIVRLDESAPIAWVEDRGGYANPYLFEIITFIRKNYSFVEEVNGVPVYQINQKLGQ